MSGRRFLFAPQPGEHPDHDIEGAGTTVNPCCRARPIQFFICSQFVTDFWGGEQVADQEMHLRLLYQASRLLQRYVIPTLTKPALVVISYTPQGTTLPSFLSSK
jgi:hypothetical protein